MSISNKQLAKAYGDSGASSSKNNLEVTEFESDIPYLFTKLASYQLLDGIFAYSAFAPDAPMQGVALRLNSTMQSSSSIHLTVDGKIPLLQ